MFRAACLVAALLCAPVTAEGPRFKFTPGETLTYSVEQTTTVTESTPAAGSVPAETATSKLDLKLTRRWAVKAVDAAGVATLELTVTAMKQDMTRTAKPGAEPDKFGVDSSTPEGRKQLAPVMDKPVLVVKLDPTGALISADSPAGTGTGRVAAELPFRIVFPATVPGVNKPWTRPAVLTLDPPHGTGEKVALVQTCTLKGESAGHWVIGVTTAAKDEAKDPTAKLAVGPVLWAGDVFIDPAKGRYAGARLTVKREVEDAAGPGSKFVYESTYTEALAK